MEASGSGGGVTPGSGRYSKVVLTSRANAATSGKNSGLYTRYSASSDDSHERWIDQLRERYNKADKESEALIDSVFGNKEIESKSLTLKNINETVEKFNEIVKNKLGNKVEEVVERKIESKKRMEQAIQAEITARVETKMKEIDAAMEAMSTAAFEKYMSKKLENGEITQDIYYRKVLELEQKKYQKLTGETYEGATPSLGNEDAYYELVQKNKSIKAESTKKKVDYPTIGENGPLGITELEALYREAFNPNASRKAQEVVFYIEETGEIIRDWGTARIPLGETYTIYALHPYNTGMPTQTEGCVIYKKCGTSQRGKTSKDFVNFVGGISHEKEGRKEYVPGINCVKFTMTGTQLTAGKGYSENGANLDKNGVRFSATIYYDTDEKKGLKAMSNFFVEVFDPAKEGAITTNKGKLEEAVTMPEIGLVKEKNKISSDKEYETYQYGKATIVEGTGATASRPTLLHFAWSAGDITETKTWESLKDSSQLENWNVVGVLNKNKNVSWSSIAGSQGLCEYVKKGVEEGTIDPKNIYIGGYSLAGKGACEAVDALHGLKVTLPNGQTTTVEIKGVDFVSGAVDGTVTSEKVRGYLEEGISVGIYASELDKKNKLSANGRKLVDEFAGTPGFTGEVVSLPHNEDFVKKVYEDYEIAETPVRVADTVVIENPEAEHVIEIIPETEEVQVNEVNSNDGEILEPEKVSKVEITADTTLADNRAMEILKNEAKRQQDPYAFLFSKVMSKEITLDMYSKIAENMQREKLKELTGKTLEEYLGVQTIPGSSAEICDLLGETIYEAKKEISEAVTVSEDIRFTEKEFAVSSCVGGFQLPLSREIDLKENVEYIYDSDIITISKTGYVTINRDKYIEKYGIKTAEIPIVISFDSGKEERQQRRITLKLTNYDRITVNRTEIAVKEGTLKESAPVIVYVGGQGEMDKKLSSQASNTSVYYLNSTKTFQSTTLTVRVREANEWNMRAAMDDVFSDIQEKVARGEIDPTKISVVTFSYGGYAGQYLAKKVNSLEGYQVENLVLLDSVQPDYGSREKRADLESLQEIMSGGTNVTVYGSSHQSYNQYGVWDACRDAVAYHESGGFDESNGKFSGRILEDPAHNGWKNDDEVVAYLDEIAGRVDSME